MSVRSVSVIDFGMLIEDFCDTMAERREVTLFVWKSIELRMTDINIGLSFGLHYRRESSLMLCLEAVLL